MTDTADQVKTAPEASPPEQTTPNKASPEEVSPEAGSPKGEAVKKKREKKQGEGKPREERSPGGKTEREEQLEEELKKAQSELEQLRQTYLRVLAEYDNFRKRTANEKTQLYGTAVADTVNAILPVADNIDRALAQENAGAEDLRKGVEMIASQFGECFRKLNLQPIGEVGEPFDPALHNAVSHIEEESLGENVISAVFQKGYKLGDRIVRHAMVQVAN